LSNFGVTYTWDDRGNLLSDSTFTYAYNAAGRMVACLGTNRLAESVTTTLVYTYNAAGLRVAQSVDGDVTTFAWDTALPLAQAMATSDGAIYLYGLDLIAQQQSNAWQYPLGDSLGSVRQWTDSGGAATYAAGYTPFGEKLWHAGNATSAWGYTGEWQDPNVGMVYLRARWYEPGLGRFTRKDPWRGNIRQPGTVNPYLYGLNNPLLCTDPTGNWCLAGFDVGPGSGCTERQRREWAAIWDTTAGFVSSPAFSEGFLLEFIDSILMGGVSIPSWVFEDWLNQTVSGRLSQLLLIMGTCGDSQAYETLRTPYSSLFNRPDPYFQLGRAIGRVAALGLALGEIGISVSGGTASLAIAGTGIGASLGAGGLVLAGEISLHAVGVIGVVIAKEIADPLITRVLMGDIPGGGNGGGEDGGGDSGGGGGGSGSSKIGNRSVADVAGNTPIKPGIQGSVTKGRVEQYAQAMLDGTFDWNKMSKFGRPDPIRFARRPNGELVLMEGHHRFLAAQLTDTPIPFNNPNAVVIENLPAAWPSSEWTDYIWR